MKIRFTFIRCRILFILLFFLPLFLEAQIFEEFKCPSEGFITQQMVKAAQQRGYQKSDETIYLKTKVFIAIAAYTNWSDTAITSSQAQERYESVNQLLADNEVGIQLEICGPVEYISNKDLFYQHYGNYNPGTMFPYHDQGYISIVFIRTMPPGAGAYVTGDLMYLRSSPRADTFAHELGHVLGLMHTHHSGYGAELVNGSNCSESGDLICDTPADPGLDVSVVDFTTCSYIGTAEDANGDLYNPQIENIMSYSPCPTTLFTQGQIEVMHYVLSDVKSYLRRTETPTLITNLSAVACNPSEPLTLIGNMGEGIFGGPNVEDGILESGMSPGEEFYVTYQPSVLPDSSTYIDQSLYTPNYLFEPQMQTEQLTEVSQSFTASANGRFVGYDFLLGNPDANIFTTSLYEGDGNSLQLLYQTTIDYPGADGFAWMQTEINSPVAVEAGSIYTIRFETINPVALYIGNGSQWPSLDYYPGHSTISGNRDAAFRTWVHALPACTQAIQYARVHTPTEYTLTNISSIYCENDMSTIYPIHNGPPNFPSKTLLDDVVINAFTPSELTLGYHEYSFHVYSEGCTEISNSGFEITSAPEVSMHSLEDIYCIDSDTIVELVGSPLGGNFTINGKPVDVLDPSAFGEGDYVVQYAYSTPLDTISTKDQWCCDGRSDLGALYNMNIGETFEQSFTPSMSGTLDSLVLLFATMGKLHTYQVAIFEGQGSGGNLLSQVKLAPSTYENEINIAGDMHPYLEAKILYTLSVTRLSGPEDVQPVLHCYANDSYAGGEGLIPGKEVSDVYFQQYITSQIKCVESDSQTVTLERCFSKPSMGIEIYPNPFSASFTLKSPIDLEYSIFTIDGRKIDAGIFYSGATTYFWRGRATSGAYILKCNTLDGKQSFIEKMVCIE